MANLDIVINEDGHKDQLNMKLDNNDLMHLLGMQPVNMALEDRLTNDFLMSDYKPMVLKPLLKRKKMSKRLKNGKRVKQNNKKSKKRVT